MKQADPKTGGFLNVKARTIDEEQQIKNLKHLAIRDDTPYVDLVFEALELVLVKHRFDKGGNPNTTLESELLPEPVFVKCKCGKIAVKFGRHLASGAEKAFCVKCFGELPARHDCKVWRFQ